MNHRVDIVALEEEFGLGARPRKPVENESEIPIVQRQPFADDLFDGLVLDHPSIRDQPLDPGAQLRVRLDVPAEDIAHGDMNDVKLLF